MNRPDYVSPRPYHRGYVDECVSRRCRGLAETIRKAMARRNHIADAGEKVD